MKKEEYESNSTVEWRARKKKILSCSFCPPNKVENAKRGCQFYKKHKSWKFLKKKTQFLNNKTP